MSGINSPSLILQTIKRNDEGEYICMTSNSIGRGQASVNIRVQCKMSFSLSFNSRQTTKNHLIAFSRCSNCSIEWWWSSFGK